MKVGFLETPYLRKPFVGALLAFLVLVILALFIGQSVLLWMLQGAAIGVAIGILIADIANYRNWEEIDST